MGPHSLNNILHSLAPYLMRLVDSLSVIFAALIAYYWRHNTFHMSNQYWLFVIIALLLLLSISGYKSTYESARGQYGFNLSKLVLFSWFFTGAILVAILVFTQSATDYSRLWLGWWWLLVLFFNIFGRFVVYSCLGFLRSVGVDQRNICIIGDPVSKKMIENKFNQNAWAGYFIDSFFDVTTYAISDLVANFRQTSTEIWICLPLEKGAVINQVLDEIGELSVDIRFVPNVQDLRLMNHSIQQIAGLNVVTLNASKISGINKIIKRFEDLLFGTFFLMLSLPFLLLIAFAIKLDSRGPILFKQKRHGVNGQEINVYKFRTMYVHTADDGNVIQAKMNDKRVTKVGRFLRKTSLDELPQFYNVLQGRMSLVGPRPHALVHNLEYKDKVEAYMARHKVKPGITGWAQVNGYRGETEILEKMEKRIEYDLYYIENWSLWFDLKIIILTVFVGLLGKNAY